MALSQSSPLTSGKAMVPPVGRGLHVPLKTDLVTKALGDLTMACLTFDGLEKGFQLFTLPWTKVL